MTAMPVGILVMGAVMWLVTIFYANLGMHANSYHSLVSFLGAIAATYFITQFSKWLRGRIPDCGRNWHASPDSHRKSSPATSRLP